MSGATFCAIPHLLLNADRAWLRDTFQGQKPPGTGSRAGRLLALSYWAQIGFEHGPLVSSELEATLFSTV